MSKSTADPITLFVDQETERILGELQQAVQGGLEEVVKQAKLAKQHRLEELEETMLHTLKISDQGIDKKLEKVKTLLSEAAEQLKALTLQKSEEHLQAAKQLQVKLEEVQVQLLGELTELKAAIKESQQLQYRAMQEAAAAVQGHISGVDAQMSSLQNAFEERLNRISNRIEQQQEDWKTYREEQALLQSVPGYISFFFGKQKALQKARTKHGQ